MDDFNRTYIRMEKLFRQTSQVTGIVLGTLSRMMKAHRYRHHNQLNDPLSPQNNPAGHKTAVSTISEMLIVGKLVPCSARGFAIEKSQ